MNSLRQEQFSEALPLLKTRYSQAGEADSGESMRRIPFGTGPRKILRANLA